MTWENNFSNVEDWLDHMAAYEHDFPPINDTNADIAERSCVNLNCDLKCQSCELCPSFFKFQAD